MHLTCLYGLCVGGTGNWQLGCNFIFHSNLTRDSYRKDIYRYRYQVEIYLKARNMYKYELVNYKTAFSGFGKSKIYYNTMRKLATKFMKSGHNPLASNTCCIDIF